MSQISSWQREEEEANPPAQNFDDEISDIKKIFTALLTTTNG
jgi:hypothetical protein